MPILAAETSEFPESLLSDFVPTGQRAWWAVYTKPRQEKALARDLVRMELPFYLPLVKKASVIRGKEVISQLPLFDGYLFLYGDEEERMRSLSTRRIANVVSPGDQLRIARDLRNIRQLIASDAPLTIESRMLPGQRVRIRSGSMKGMEGNIVLRRGQTRLLVAVDFLQQGASIAIDDFRLEAID